MGLFDSIGDALFGKDKKPASVFAGAGGQSLFDFYQQGFETSALEDPRLVTFLDKATRKIDQTFRAAQSTFERSLTERGSGDAAAFQRDLNIAKSEQRSAALTDILAIFEQLRLENASGALRFLVAESGENQAIADFGQRGRLGNIGALGQLGDFIKPG